MRRRQWVLRIKWDANASPNLPTLVGVFPNFATAEDWAKLNVPNGTWSIETMGYPYREGGR